MSSYYMSQYVEDIVCSPDDGTKYGEKYIWGKKKVKKMRKKYNRGRNLLLLENSRCIFMIGNHFPVDGLH